MGGRGAQLPAGPTRFVINQCQIIIFLILKSDKIENSRIELKKEFCQYLQIKFKLHLLSFYPSTLYICDFFLFHLEIEGTCGWIIRGGGGAKGMLPSPSQIIGGGGGVARPARLFYSIISHSLGRSSGHHR